MFWKSTKAPPDLRPLLTAYIETQERLLKFRQCAADERDSLTIIRQQLTKHYGGKTFSCLGKVVRVGKDTQRHCSIEPGEIEYISIDQVL